MAIEDQKPWNKPVRTNVRQGRGGLGRRFSEIEAELDIQYPAYEGLFRKSTEYEEDPQTPFSLPEFDAEDDTEGTLSFYSVLSDLGLAESLFNTHLVALSEEEGAGPSASTRVAAYLYSLPEGRGPTDSLVIDLYSKLRFEGKEETFTKRFEANLYVKWQKYAKGVGAYVTVYEDLTLKAFIEFSKATSLGRAINDLTSMGVSYKKSEDSAAALLI